MQRLLAELQVFRHEARLPQPLGLTDEAGLHEAGTGALEQCRRVVAALAGPRGGRELVQAEVDTAVAEHPIGMGPGVTGEPLREAEALVELHRGGYVVRWNGQLEKLAERGSRRHVSASPRSRVRPEPRGRGCAPRRR